MTIRPAPTAVRLFAALLPLMAAGCGDLLKQPYPAKAFYGIEPGTPQLPAATVVNGETGGYINRDADVVATTRPTDGAIMVVRPVRVSPPYDGLAFVYRDGPAQYTTDYYVNFIAPPSALLTGSLTDWLDRAGPTAVVTTGSAVRQDLVLDGAVTQLVIDRTDAKRPKAIVVARFFLTRENGSGSSVISDTAYSASVPVSPDAAAGYADGWGKAWRQVLQRLSADLQTAVAPRR